MCFVLLAIYEKADIPKDVLNAFAWQSRRSAVEVMRFREHVMQTLEHASEQMWSNGLCSQWLAGVDPGVAKVSATVNGIMLENLGSSVGYEDMQCIQMFREGQSVCSFQHKYHVQARCVAGAPLYGQLPKSGISESKDGIPTCSEEELKANCRLSNEKLLNKLKPDTFAKELHKQALADAEKGRMSWPTSAIGLDLDSIRLSPRYGMVFPHTYMLCFFCLC